MSWVGHVWRVMGQTVHEITEWKTDKKGSRGRPRQRWIDRVREDIKLLGISRKKKIGKKTVFRSGGVQKLKIVYGTHVLILLDSRKLRFVTSSRCGGHIL